MDSVKKTTLIVIIVVLSTSPIILASTFATPSTVTDVYISNVDDLWWSGASNVNINGDGYITPPGDAIWTPAIQPIWKHHLWNTLLKPPEYKAKISSSPSADWIWRSYQVTDSESYTGDIIFFKKHISIPGIITEAHLYITTDNAYYVYVNNPDWSGTPNGIDGFTVGYGPTNFYYIADGTNKSGGEDSTIYEIVGDLYPFEASISASTANWGTIENYDITNLLKSGENWLQIVVINEHAPAHGFNNNPAGLIYKLEVTYENHEVIVEKDFRYTDDVTFTPFDGDEQLPAELGDLLPRDNNGNYIERVQRYNDYYFTKLYLGQLYGVITLTSSGPVLNVILMDSFGVQFDVNPAKMGGGVEVVVVDEYGYATVLTYQPGIMGTVDNDGNLLGIGVNLLDSMGEPLQPGSALMIYVRFKHNYTGGEFINTATIVADGKSKTASANLILLES